MERLNGEFYSTELHTIQVSKTIENYHLI